MHVKIPADLQDEYVEFMHPFIMSKMGGGQQTSKTPCAGIVAGASLVDLERALMFRLDSIDPVHAQAGNSFPKRSAPQEMEVTEKHGTIKKTRLDEDEIEAADGGAILEPNKVDLDSNSYA
ncbi:hypothetical protein HDU98_010100 [Podochytrium sp. JEL0797]|nr:hypothetical protein HDU98_010100 [Podochytrium sp. JEL0797]